jgi:polyhydroxyalkanoate synthesis regulator phasin
LFTGKEIIMDENNVTDVLKKGFQVTLGAATSLAESLQDERKREENISQLNLGFDKVTEIWAEKGAVTEIEGRKMIDSMMEQYGPNSNTYSTPGTTPTSTSPGLDPGLHQEIRDLTTQLAAIRMDLTQTGPDTNS